MSNPFTEAARSSAGQSYTDQILEAISHRRYYDMAATSHAVVMILVFLGVLPFELYYRLASTTWPRHCLAFVRGIGVLLATSGILLSIAVVGPNISALPHAHGISGIIAAGLLLLQFAVSHIHLRLADRGTGHLDLSNGYLAFALSVSLYALGLATAVTGVLFASGKSKAFLVFCLSMVCADLYAIYITLYCYYWNREDLPAASATELERIADDSVSDAVRASAETLQVYVVNEQAGLSEDGLPPYSTNYIIQQGLENNHELTGSNVQRMVADQSLPTGGIPRARLTRTWSTRHESRTS